MKTLLIFISTFLFFGCVEHDQEALLNNNVVLTAVLRSGAEASGVRIYRMADDAEALSELRELSVRLYDDNGHSELLHYNGDGYSSNNMTITPGTKYDIETRYENKDISSTCEIPPQIVLVNITQSNIDVDESSEGMPVTTVSWNELASDKYTYVLKLENLEQNKEAIPFDVTSGNFERFYETPVINNSVTLFDTDFFYYGNHRLTVYAIERKLESIYFYDSSDIRGLLQFAPDNILGAQGFFTGVSSFSINLLIQ